MRIATTLVLHVAFLLTIGTTPIFAGAQSDGPVQTWSGLEGAFLIDAPGHWLPATGEQIQAHSPAGYRPLGALADPDGQAFFGLYRIDEAVAADQMDEVMNTVVKVTAGEGARIRERGKYGIGGRPFGILLASHEEDGEPVEVFCGITPLADHMLVALFKARGPDREEIIFQAQLALGTVVILETGETDPDRSAAALPLPTVAAPEGAAAVAGILARATDRTDDQTAETAGAGAASLLAGSPRRSIPGTGLALQMPSGYVEATTTPGFVSANSRTVLYAEPYPLPVAMARSLVSDHSLQSRDLAPKEQSEVLIDGRSSLLTLVEVHGGDGPRNGWILMTGDKQRTWTVFAFYDQTSDLRNKRELRAALMSLTWNDEVVPFALDGLDFTYTESAHLITLNRAHDRVVLAPPGSSIPVDQSDTYLVIGSRAYPHPAADLESLAEQVATLSPLLSNPEFDTGRPTTLDGVAGHELTGEYDNPDTGERMAFYQAVAVKNGRLYVVQGCLRPSTSMALQQEFAEIAASLRLQPE